MSDPTTDAPPPAVADRLLAPVTDQIDAEDTKRDEMTCIAVREARFVATFYRTLLEEQVPPELREELTKRWWFRVTGGAK
jgi:hypothetical protein